MIKNLILSKAKEYLKFKDIKTSKVGKMIMFSCPFCETGTANTIPNSTNLNCLDCKKRFTLIDIVRKLENREDSEDKIIEYLKGIFKIDGVVTKKEENELDELLNYYEKNKWALVAISPNSKIPIEQMKGWSTKEYRNKEEWGGWLINKLNLAARTGAVSNITVLDIDVLLGKEKEEFRFIKITEKRKKELLNKREEGLNIVYNQIKNIMGEPLIQENLGGEQLIYQFDSDFPKTKIDIEGIHIDIENEGGYILIEPSKLGTTSRKFKELKDIPKMPEELKKFLLEKTTVPRKTNSEAIREDIQTEDFKLELFPEGTRNASLIKLGGIFRKNLNIKQTEFVLQVLNSHNIRSGDFREIQAMVGQLDKYIIYDEAELAHEILEHVKEVKEVTKSDLELSIAGEWTKGEAKKRFNKTIQYLIKEEKIIQRGKKIIIIEDLNWKDTLMDIGSPVDFKVPYLHDYAHFCKGDIIILGSMFGYGKSTLAINMIKRLVIQKIKPYYIYSEKQGGRFARTAVHLGLREGDFYSARCSNPDDVILRPNSVTIYDWVRPNKEGGFARTDLLFDKLVEKAEKTNSFLICFVQLREDDSFFAKDQIGQYPSVLLKYMHESKDGIYTKFVFKKIREPKIQGSNIEVPCIYNWQTKEVKLVEEFDKKEQEQLKKQLEKEKEKK